MLEEYEELDFYTKFYTNVYFSVYFRAIFAQTVIFGNIYAVQ